MNEAAAIPGQLAFDLDDLIRQAQRDRAGEWCGAPLGYTVDYYMSRVKISGRTVESVLKENLNYG